MSWRRNSSASSTTSFRSSGRHSGACFAVIARMRWTISLAWRALATIRVVSWTTFARFGSSRDSQRRLVSALVKMAASGWLTSCAIEVASSPRVEIRAARVKSAWSWRSCASVRSRSVRSSRPMTVTSSCSGGVGKVTAICTSSSRPSSVRSFITSAWLRRRSKCAIVTRRAVSGEALNRHSTGPTRSAGFLAPNSFAAAGLTSVIRTFRSAKAISSGWASRYDSMSTTPSALSRANTRPIALASTRRRGLGMWWMSLR